MEISLRGRVALVTGGSRGIGLAVATKFAESVADVAIVARGREALDRAVAAIGLAANTRVFSVVGDVANADDVVRAYDETMRVFGRIDVVVNNAGTSRNGAFESISDEVWQQDLEQKLFAAIRLTRLVWPQMTKRRWGRVINVLNIGAKAPKPKTLPTSVTRAAGMALTKALANEGAPHNVLVNALLVGFIDSSQVPQMAANAGLPLQEFVIKRSREIPLGRPGRTEEFANLACFLASEAASYITGTAINVDGGSSPIV
jgi:NAD(P)-dependent dehydrogenase (short-subunit alcohol dehydrogenase family)